MAESFKDRVEGVGHSLAETAAKVGHTVSATAEGAADWATEKAHQLGDRVGEAARRFEHTASSDPHEAESASMLSDIREHMEVIGSCGNRLGQVDRVEGAWIKLARSDSPDGRHHLIPTAWVTRVDRSVHLGRDCGEARREWETA